MISFARALLWLAAIAALAAGAVGYYWSEEPAPFNVIDQAILEAEEIERPVVEGTATTAVVIHLVEVLLEKPGGFLANDRLPPGILMDDLPQWEYGVMVMVRDMTRALHDRIGRKQGYPEDDDITIADARFRIAHDSRFLPDTGSEYQAGAEHLRDYLRRLSNTRNPGAQFDASPENLVLWLKMVEVRLDGLLQQLGSCVREDAYGVATQAANQEAAPVYASWHQVDNIFFEARGSAWALSHLLQAVEIDFSRTLKKQEARPHIARILRELEPAIAPLKSPVILNGGNYSIWANHPQVLASYLFRARTEVVALREKVELGVIAK